jgi:uncharacterized membrane protein YdjX (TVP38/TMEM64 family)
MAPDCPTNTQTKKAAHFMLNPNKVVESEGVFAPTLLLRRHWPKLTAMTLWAGVLVGFFWLAQTQGLSLLDALLLVRNSAYGPLWYIGLYTLRPLLFFPASILTIAGGLFFGPVGGLLYSTVASNLSALLAYVVGRYLGQGLLESSDSTSLVQRYANRMRRNSFETVLIMRLILLPYDLVNYLSGFLRIDWRAFLLATVIGSLPITLSLVLIGVAGDLEELAAGKIALNPWALAGSVLFIGISLAVSRLIRRREQVDQET